MTKQPKKRAAGASDTIASGAAGLDVIVPAHVLEERRRERDGRRAKAAERGPYRSKDGDRPA
jgi:hypothetical protein